MDFERYDLQIIRTEYKETIIANPKAKSMVADLSFLMTEAMPKEMVVKEIDRICKYIREKLKRELLNGRK